MTEATMTMLELQTVVFRVDMLEVFRSTGTGIPDKDHTIWLEGHPAGPGLYRVLKTPQWTFKFAAAPSNVDALYAGNVFDADPGPIYVDLVPVPLD